MMTTKIRTKFPRESEKENPNWNYRFKVEFRTSYVFFPERKGIKRIVARCNKDAIYRLNKANYYVTKLELLGRTGEAPTSSSAI